MISLRVILLSGLLTLCLIGMGCDSRGKAESQSISVESTPEQKFLATLKRAEAGEVEAQLEVGLAYTHGEAVEIDDAKAFDWFKKAADADDPRGIYWIGVAYQMGRGTPKNFERSCKYYELASDKGDPKGEIQLGVCYLLGFGGKIDKPKAIKIWKANAEKTQLPHVHRLLGVAYQLGEGVTRDHVISVEYFKKAAEATPTDRSSRSSIARAQFDLSVAYEEGLGVSKSKEQALYWLTKAVDNGEVEAQYVLGYKYYEGDGVILDNQKAFDLFEQGAKRGFARSQSMLGFLYGNGNGTVRDYVLAYAWTNLAAASGDSTAKSNRKHYEKQLVASENSEAQRLSASWKRGKLLTRESAAEAPSTSEKFGKMELKKNGSGTAFLVSKDGHVITNHHVIDSCKEVRLEGRDGAAKVVTEDKINDLALLKISGSILDIAMINSDPSSLRQGDEVVVFGFPLNSVLSSGGNLTPGIVSALTGLGNNTNQVQITAPIQPGSSGSPVLNKKAQVIGVVSSKISDTKLARATGQVGQNINFAISGLTLKTFLDTHKVNYKTSGIFSFGKSTADIADEAKKWTLVAECWN